MEPCPAAFSVNYEQVGVAAGKIAAEILKGKDPKTIAPWRPAYEDHAPVISKKAMAAFGVEIPADRWPTAAASSTDTAGRERLRPLSQVGVIGRAALAIPLPTMGIAASPPCCT